MITLLNTTVQRLNSLYVIRFYYIIISIVSHMVIFSMIGHLPNAMSSKTANIAIERAITIMIADVPRQISMMTSFEIAFWTRVLHCNFDFFMTYNKQIRYQI